MIPERYRDVIEFDMDTDWRVGELIALKMKDIDLKNMRALIRRPVSAYVHIIETTKGRSKKYIPLSNRALEIAKKSAIGRFPEEYILINPDTGKRYPEEMPNVLWKRYTGLQVTHYEASRHSFCTQLADDGIDALQAKELMRHTDVRTAHRYYHADVSRLSVIVNNQGRVTRF
jgi:integrase